MLRTADLFGIKVAAPNTPKKLRNTLPQAAYGQGQVTATPWQMARVAAAIANDGVMPSGRWVIEAGEPRPQKPQQILRPDQARRLGGFMRSVVTGGTGRRLRGGRVPIAGKTGTAELKDQTSHAWFVGFAPYGSNVKKQIAFAVIIENGGYGGETVVPAVGDIVSAAADLRIIR